MASDASASVFRDDIGKLLAESLCRDEEEVNTVSIFTTNVLF